MLRLKNQEVGETRKEILPCHIRKYLIPDVSPGYRPVRCWSKLTSTAKHGWYIQLEGNSGSGVQQGQ